MDSPQGTGNEGSSANCVNIQCTWPGCRCQSFSTSPDNVRQCRNCPHGWVPHALDRIGIVYQWDRQKFEQVGFNSVFDVASLILFGTHGIPLRLHICLQRLMACLDNDQINRIIKQFEWTWEEFCRGSKLVGPDGSLLSKWSYATINDETMILGHFLKYKVTQTVATNFLREIIVQKCEENPYLQMVTPAPESGLQTFFLQNQSKPVVASTSPASTSQSTSLPSSPAPANTTSLLLQTTHRPLVQGDTNNQLTSLFLRAVQNGTLQVPQAETHISGLQPSGGTLSITLPSQLPVPPQSHGKRKLQPKPPAPPTPISQTENGTNCSTPPGSVVGTTLQAVPAPSSFEITYASQESHVTSSSRKSTAKRVNCEHCSKSFCDKGALKIHYSAVHLKEMHRCSVDGCKMMFSSRRSRNRHASNPNPRLHSNLFQPRRGGILAGESESTEGDRSNEGDGMEMNIHISDSEDEDNSDEERSGEGNSRKRERSEDSIEGKLVIAEEERSKDPKPGLDGHEEPTVRYPSPCEKALDFSMKARKSAEGVKQLRSLSEQPLSRSPPKHPVTGGSSVDGDDETGSLKDVPMSDISQPNPQIRSKNDERKAIPSDPSDPCKCPECGKLFKNQFTVRTHIMNVHLKVMHKCVTGL